MVAKIKSGKSLIGALNYNENKVKQGKAKLIAAVKYFKEPKDLSFDDKLLRLTDLASMNQRAKTNTVHISLNFPTGENLADDKLNDIVKDYLAGVGFGTQPYLVYRHEDAGHPHCHIVTTNIKRDGERISLHYLGQNESEKTRKVIEIKYGLVKAEDQKKLKPNLKADISAAELRKPYKDELIKILDSGLINPLTSRDFQKALGEKGIQCILRQSEEGRIYGVTFIDLKSKTVFNGSDLGKAYSANILSLNFLPEPVNAKSHYQNESTAVNYGSQASSDVELLDVLFATERDDLAALNKFKKKKLKKLNL